MPPQQPNKKKAGPAQSRRKPKPVKQPIEQAIEPEQPSQAVVSKIDKQKVEKEEKP
jgi:hypothetical protein